MFLLATIQTTNNAGCNYLPPASHTHTYGDTFNAVGGGVYALDWTSEAIRIWHWPRQRIPADIVAKRPDPSGWGLPSALFGTSTCNVDQHFKNMSIVIQTVRLSAEHKIGGDIAWHCSEAALSLSFWQ